MDLHNLQEILVSEKAEIEKSLFLDTLATQSKQVAAGLKRKRPAVEPVPEGLLRRSTRSIPRVDYKEDAIAIRQSIQATATPVHVSLPIDSLAAVEEAAPQAAIRLPTEPPSGSLKTLPANIEYMRKTYLGGHVPIRLGGEGNQAKRAVMNTACGKPGVRPTFSKMTGIQEWSNAIFLFMNVGEGTSNEFLEEGRIVTWYAQNRQSIFSAQIQRLIHHRTGVSYPSPELIREQGADATTAETTFLEPCSVALICRVNDEPYIWCGSLEYVSHDSKTHPLKFHWRLSDYDDLKGDGTNEFCKMLRKWTS